MQGLHCLTLSDSVSAVPNNHRFCEDVIDIAICVKAVNSVYSSLTSRMLDTSHIFCNWFPEFDVTLIEDLNCVINGTSKRIDYFGNVDVCRNIFY